MNEWGPARHVMAPQKCCTCGGTIQKASPGFGGEWECLGCHDERTTTELAENSWNDAIRNHVQPLMDLGDEWDVLVDSRFRVIKGGGKLWEVIRSGVIGETKIRAVPVTIGFEMEAVLWSDVASAKGCTSGATYTSS
jgi:hypothetical protein